VAGWVAQTLGLVRQKSGSLHRIFAFLPNSYGFDAVQQTENPGRFATGASD
jgi:hypothetical protein